jgi:pimeloyl-ACP methyl ester carboxylesterase
MIDQRMNAIALRNDLPGSADGPCRTVAPYFFGDPGKRLFGCYHAAHVRSVRDCGIVLCYPMGQEYIRSYRAFRQMALLLAEAGFHTLRFDFLGCGDSMGDAEAMDLGQWQADIATAMAALRSRAGLSRICLLGLRLGGTLATLVGAARLDVDGLVLWDPVVDGRAYVDELRAWHRRRLDSFPVQLKRRPDNGGPQEVLGFELTAPLLEGLAGIDLLATRARPARQVLIVESQRESALAPFGSHLVDLDTPVDHRFLPTPMIWIEDINKVLVPHEVLQAVVAWLVEAYR